MSEVGLPTKLVAIAGGAASAVAVEKLTGKVLPTHRADLGAIGLIIAAWIYPAARRGEWFGAAAGREVAGIAAASAVAAAAVKPNDKARRAVVAAGWVAHAVFDHVHHAGAGGRLPRWYPALCAGYDIAFAAMLMRPDPQRSDEFVNLNI